MHIVIVGAGRVGARAANILSETHDVTIVDKNPSSFDRLSADFSGRAVLGNGIDVDVLREAGCEQADIFMALTDFDNSNIMASEVARSLGAKRAIARVYDPVRGHTFSLEGVTAVSPTVNAARNIFTMITGEEAS